MKTHQFTESLVHELLMGMVPPEEQILCPTTEWIVKQIRIALLLKNNPDATISNQIDFFIRRYNAYIPGFLSTLLAQAILPREKSSSDITIKKMAA